MDDVELWAMEQMERWKGHAARLREAARTQQDPVQRDTMLWLAEDCEALAWLARHPPSRLHTA